MIVSVDNINVSISDNEIYNKTLEKLNVFLDKEKTGYKVKPSMLDGFTVIERELHVFVKLVYHMGQFKLVLDDDYIKENDIDIVFDIVSDMKEVVAGLNEILLESALEAKEKVV